MADPTSILDSPLLPIYLVDDGINQGVPCRVSTRPRQQGVSSSRDQLTATIGGTLRVGKLILGLTAAKISREDFDSRDGSSRPGHGPIGYLQIQRKGYDWALVILQYGSGTLVRVPDETGRARETGTIVQSIAKHDRMSKIAENKESVDIMTSVGGLTLSIRGKGLKNALVASSSESIASTSLVELESNLMVTADIRPSDIGSWVISCTDPREIIGMVVDVYPSKSRSLRPAAVVHPFYKIMSEINEEYLGGVFLPQDSPAPIPWKKSRVEYIIDVTKQSRSRFKQWIAEKYSGGRESSRNGPEPKRGFQLDGEEAKTWEDKIRPLVAAVIRKTPPTPRTEPSPIVKSYGLSVEVDRERRLKVVIVCASEVYSQQIQRAIRQRRILDRSGFELMIADKVVRCKPKDDRYNMAVSGGLGSKGPATDVTVSGALGSKGSAADMV